MKSISETMRQGNTATIKRMIATRKNCVPKTNHHFCPPLISQADTDKSRAICKTAI